MKSLEVIKAENARVPATRARRTRTLSKLQVEVMMAATKAYPAWFRARSSGERVTLASLWRAGFLERRAWRGKEGSANAANEYRPVADFIRQVREHGL